jgi:nucleotide-binding universal stress UspA family protein
MTGHPFERILLATEHTEFDVGAEAVALELARRCGVPLAAVLPIVTNPEYEVTDPALARSVEHLASVGGEALRAAAAAARVELDLSIRRGEEAYREIIAEARARRADLIVARRRGKQGFLARAMVGEMVGNVVREAPCSVLLVPRACRMWNTRILVAVDDAPTTSGVVAAAIRVAAGCGLPLVVASVAAQDTTSARAHADAAADAGLRAVEAAGAHGERRVVVGPPAERIAALAGDTGADLIVIGRGGSHSALRRMVFGGTARRIVGLAACPVLIVAASG